jgi:hypothetical protein
MIFVPHTKNTFWSPRPVMGMALHFNMQIMMVPHRKHTYGPASTVTKNFTLLTREETFLVNLSMKMQAIVT